MSGTFWRAFGLSFRAAPDRRRPGRSVRERRPCLSTLEGAEMKRRDTLKLAVVAAALLSTTSLFTAHDGIAQDKKLRIGFSQATTIEPWRAQFNKDIIAEAAKHPEVELIITDGEDKTEKQVADVENLIRQEVDALLISPKESAGLTGVVQQAIDAKIPVFVLDRNVETDKY